MYVSTKQPMIAALLRPVSRKVTQLVTGAWKDMDSTALVFTSLTSQDICSTRSTTTGEGAIAAPRISCLSTL
jgi:hypothetical protein